MSRAGFFGWLVVVLCCAVLVACGKSSNPPADQDTLDQPESTDLGDTDPGDTDATEQDVEAEVEPPPMPHALCGMAAYDLLPREQVGHLLSWEDVYFDLTPTAVDNLLANYGYTAISPRPFGARVFRFRYTTQDRGQLVEATATLGVPAHAELPSGKLPLVISLHGTTGFSSPCAPSRGADGPAQAALVASNGWVAVAPDYIGMVGFGDPLPDSVRHGYLVGEQTALGSWDALRAAEELLADPDFRALFDTGERIRAGKTVIIWGFSQGGHASLVTELYGPYYAPEYQVAAVAEIIGPTSIRPLMQAAVESVCAPTGALAAVLVTMRHWYGAPADYTGVFSDVEPYHFAQTADSRIFTEEECNPGEGLDGDRVDQLYDTGFIAKVLGGQWDALEPWTCYLDEASLTTTTVPVLRHTPTLVLWSSADDLVITDRIRGDFNTLCEKGYQLEHMECIGAGHSEGAVWSMPEQIAWITARLAGEPIAPAKLCHLNDAFCCSATDKPEVCVPEEE